VAGFIGSPRMNFLSGKVVDISRDGVAVEVPEVGRLRTLAAPAVLQLGEGVTLGIRPEHVTAGHVQGGGGDGNRVSGAVASVEQLGGLSYVRLASPDVTAQVPGQTGLGRGDVTSIGLPAADIHVFDAKGLTLPRVAATPE
jgi:multiple sugar transport system ATP-binding protein